MHPKFKTHSSKLRKSVSLKYTIVVMRIVFKIPPKKINAYHRFRVNFTADYSGLHEISREPAGPVPALQISQLWLCTRPSLSLCYNYAPAF